MNKKTHICFSIDEIIYDKITHKEKSYFTVRVIPDSKSEYYHPFHLRYINIMPSLLEIPFLKQTDIKPLSEIKGTGSVIQGGYYCIPYTRISPKTLFSPNNVIGEADDVFLDHIETSPYGEADIKGKIILQPVAS